MRENSEENIRKYEKLNRQNLHITDNKMVFKIIALCLFGIVGLINERLSADQNCPFCNSEIKFVIVDSNRGIFAETWTCSDINCGYENYVGIYSCGICGKSR